MAVLLQGLWAGIFLQHDGRRPAAEGWVQIHADGATLAIVLAITATLVGYVRLRARRELWAGSAVPTVLLVLESYLGGAVVDQHKDALTIVHVPLALALMTLVAWLPLHARAKASEASF